MRFSTGTAVLIAALLLAGAAGAKSPDFLVNSTVDPGVGGCDAGECTLREAIQALNAQGKGSIGFDPAVFPATPAAPIGLTSALPPLRGSKVSVDGSNAHVVIDAANSGGAPGLTFDSGPGTPLSDVVLRGVTVIESAGHGVWICGGDSAATCDEAVSRIVVDRVGVFSPTQGGVVIAGSQIAKLTLVRNATRQAGGPGLDVDALGPIGDVTILGNVARNGAGDGIRVESNASPIRKLKILDNAVVARIADGIRVETGAGVESVSIVGNHVTDAEGHGIRVRSGGRVEGGSLVDNLVQASGFDGIRIEADQGVSGLKLERNTSDHHALAGGDGDAISVLSAAGSLTKTRIADNLASGAGNGINAAADVELQQVKIEDNTAFANDLNGIQVDGKPGSKQVSIVGNRADSNGSVGILIACEAVTASRNVAMDNEDGILLDGTADKTHDTRVEKNAVIGNRHNGIFVDVGVTGAVLQKNRARGNNAALVAAFDLTEQSADCGSNTWSKNDFGSTNQTCVE